MKHFIHLIADYGTGDPAFAEVIQRLKVHLADADIFPTSVPSFSTLATGFWIGQLGLYQAIPDMLIYSNTAPRRDNHLPRKTNEGEPLAYARLKNGSKVIAVLAGFSFSFIKYHISEFQLVNVERHGSQFRSRDLFPEAVAQIILGNDKILGQRLDIASIPDIPSFQLAHIDGYGNLKTTIRIKGWQFTSGEVTISISGMSHQVKVADGIFSVPSKTLVIAPGSSGGDNPFQEISCRDGSAAQAFGNPPVESSIGIKV
jgi:hypothetical protein